MINPRSTFLWPIIAGLYRNAKMSSNKMHFTFSFYIFLKYCFNLNLCKSIYNKHILIKINIYSAFIINIKYVIVIHIIRLYGAKEKLKPSTKGMNRPLEAVP
jgi:hypothetical protein